MLFVFGIVTYMCFIVSISLFISAILMSSNSNDLEGREQVGRLLMSSMIFMGIYFMGSVGVVLMSIIKSVRKDKETYSMRRIRTEPFIQEIVTGSSGAAIEF
jgi:hypothetical protein